MEAKQNMNTSAWQKIGGWDWYEEAPSPEYEGYVPNWIRTYIKAEGLPIANLPRIIVGRHMLYKVTTGEDWDASSIGGDVYRRKLPSLREIREEVRACQTQRQGVRARRIKWAAERKDRIRAAAIAAGVIPK